MRLQKRALCVWRKGVVNLDEAGKVQRGVQSSWVEYTSDGKINNYTAYPVLALERPGEDITVRSKVICNNLGQMVMVNKKGALRVTCKSDTDHE